MPKAQRSPMRAMPAESEIITTLPPRAQTSSMFEKVFSNSASGGATTTTGTLSSMRAIGPGFISGAAAEIEDVAGKRDLGGDRLDRLVVMQDFGGARRHLGELAGEAGFLRGVDRAARPRHRDRESDEDGELRRESLGRGDADLGAGEGRQ